MSVDIEEKRKRMKNLRKDLSFWFCSPRSLGETLSISIKGKINTISRDKGMLKSFLYIEKVFF